MVDPEAVRRRLRELDRRLQALRGIANEGEPKFFGSEALRTQAERHLQLAIQSSIDVAVHIVAEDSSHTPEDYGSAFVLLAEMGVLETELAQRLRAAAGVRNILVHGYLDVDPGRLWEHLMRLEDFERFAASIEDYMKR